MALRVFGELNFRSLLNLMSAKFGLFLGCFLDGTYCNGYPSQIVLKCILLPTLLSS